MVRFVTLLVCQKTAFTSSGRELPPGLTTFVSAQNCPIDSGWGTTPGTPGRFLVGMAGTGTQGAAFGGDPMGPNETSRSHTHVVNGSINVSEHNTDLTHAGKSLQLGKTGTASYTITSAPA